MNMKVRAMILLVLFGGLLYFPFLIHAGSGNIFTGLPLPILNSSAAAEEDSDSGDQNSETVAETGGLDAAAEEYAQSLPKPAIGSASVQQSISIDDMRNHMNTLRQEDRTTTQCLACHNKPEFCDRCHNYSGINPQFDN